MEVRVINKEDYRVFRERSVNKLVFNDPEWLKLVCENGELSFYAIYNNNQVLSVFYLYKIRGRFLTTYSSPLLTPRNGLIYNDSEENYSFKRNILNMFENFIFKLKADSFYYTFNISDKDFLPFKNNFGISLHLTYTIDLSQSEGLIFSNFRKDKQRNIKQAEKLNYHFTTDKNPDLISELIKKTYSRQNKANHWIEKVNSIVSQYPNSYQITVFQGNVPASSLFFVFDTEAVYYLFGGYDDSLKNYSAGPFAMWQGILHGKKLGLKKFDFEGSEIPQIESYFQTFGGQQENYFSIYRHSFIQKLLSSQK